MISYVFLKKKSRLKMNGSLLLNVIKAVGLGGSGEPESKV
jgi:hypothetical protein